MSDVECIGSVSGPTHEAPGKTTPYAGAPFPTPRSVSLNPTYMPYSAKNEASRTLRHRHPIAVIVHVDDFVKQTQVVGKQASEHANAV